MPGSRALIFAPKMFSCGPIGPGSLRGKCTDSEQTALIDGIKKHLEDFLLFFGLFLGDTIISKYLVITAERIMKNYLTRRFGM